jgi:hypothetical protein
MFRYHMVAQLVEPSTRTRKMPGSNLIGVLPFFDICVFCLFVFVCFFVFILFFCLFILFFLFFCFF